MKFIAHRGNLTGPNAQRENSPDYIDEAIAASFDVEVDLRAVDGHLWLGHDYPQHLVSREWLSDRHHRLLLHIKDIPALNWMLNTHPNWHYFCHAGDRFTFTSQRYIWLHDLSLPPTPDTIVPLISRELVLSYRSREVHAICSDYTIW